MKAQSPSTQPPDSNGHRRLTVGLGILASTVTVVFALWYVSAGRFPDFPSIQNDYVDLGDAFLHGRLLLPDKPDPRLADLGNPYDYAQRKGIPYHWDASYYDGKYYLYWGPAPAAVSAALEWLSGARPAASVFVVIAFIASMAVFVALLDILGGRRAHGTGGAGMWPFILIAFFSLPSLFIIGQPRHYQASILYGQFFLLSGVLGFALHLDRRSMWLLVAAGLAWGLAIASRYNLALSVAAYTVLAISWLTRRASGNSNWIGVFALCAPLALCMAGLGAYNFARFHDPLETGITYQLTIRELREITYSLSYVRSNVYVYLLYPLEGAGMFPFIQSPHFHAQNLPAWAAIAPGREFDQIIFGMLPSVPAAWIGLLAIPTAILGARRSISLHQSTPAAAGSTKVLTMLAAGAACQFGFLMVFFYAAERYILDFYLPLVLVLAAASWTVSDALERHRHLQYVLWGGVVALALWTAAIAYFACFGVPNLVANFYDPKMVAHQAAFWNQIPSWLGSSAISPP